MKKNRRRLKHRLLSFLLLVMGISGSIVAFCFGFSYVTEAMDENRERATVTSIRDLTLEVSPHATLEEIATVLDSNDFIGNKLWFLLQSKLHGYEGKLNPGTYVVSNNMSDLEILDLLTMDEAKEADVIKFTIPEGYTVIQIASRLDDLGIVSKEDFLKAVNEKDYDYSFLKYIPQDTKYRLEGYLFPDTYIVPKQVTAEQIVIKMLNRFQEVVGQYTQYLYDSHYTLHDVLTIASIIEQEAKLAEERPIISGVIYNRLDTDMKLQMCSSVQYVLDKRKKNLSYDDLKVESPYNTYLYEGLPVGPICMPGEEALRAAFMPEHNEYYYFVLKDPQSGEHAFSKSSSEHARNKSKYAQTNDINFYE
ncbi:MAG: endolytic transglycosylase MltG [Cellulosilyticaceae bacterium]